MNGFLAIVGDTWRQSRQQVVFIILAFVMVVWAGFCVVVPTTMTDDDRNTQFTTLFDGAKRDRNSERRYVEIQGHARMREQKKAILDKVDWKTGETNTSRDYLSALQEAEAATAHLTSLEKSARGWSFISLQLAFMLLLLGFIATCSGYFPGMLDQGSIDVVLSKPISRLQAFLGKYFGGLVLFTVLTTAFCTVLFIGLKVRLGVFVPSIFLFVPATVFSAAVLYALLALLGIYSRSTALAMVLGYVFYIVIDTGIEFFLNAVHAGMINRTDFIDTCMEIVPRTFPNFGLLKTTALEASVGVQNIDWRNTMTSACWLVLTLALGFWKFRKTDY